ncbi:MAG: glycoside hydrolase family 43 protein [Verrucomicrobia bacterium]|nr:glycoside hydrolase family 43 protein [Verrucomicrobiota bacterium]
MFLFAHFITGSEALYFAFSDNGLDWSPCNRGKPFLRSVVGSLALRDPFVRKGEDGLFHLVWTDGWVSPYIGYANSPDLVNWSEQKALPVMLDVADVRNTWAPEFIYHPQQKLYYLFWSSTLGPLEGSDPRHYRRDHRIWCCTTPDFKTFSQPRLFFDPGYSVIDATLVTFNDAFYMAFKDERGENTEGTAHKAMQIARTADINQPHWEVVSHAYITPALSEGPAIFRSGPSWTLLYDEFTRERYAAVTSTDLVHWRAVDQPVQMPHRARHGSVIEISDAEFSRIPV